MTIKKVKYFLPFSQSLTLLKCICHLNIEKCFIIINFRIVIIYVSKELHIRMLITLLIKNLLISEL